MRKVITGDQVAQIRNPDPFAFPIWRAPVYRTPGWIIAIAQLCRFIFWLVRLVVRHPVVSLVLAVLGFTWSETGWLGVTLLVVWAVLVLVCWRVVWPVSFARRVGCPGAEHVAGVAVPAPVGVGDDDLRARPWYQGRIILPVLGKVRSTRYVDRVQVRLVSGQSAAAGRRRRRQPGARVRRDPVPRPDRPVRCGAAGVRPPRRPRPGGAARPGPGLPRPAGAGSRPPRRRAAVAGPAARHPRPGRRARPGAGKASLLWGLVRAMSPLMQDGLVRVLAADPKLMELAFGRIIFDTHGDYAADPAAIADMLDRAVADMQRRAARFAGYQRDHTPTREHPFTVVLVDEVAFLTAYQPDRKLRERIMNALATLTTQGRAVGYCVVAALQDPRKEVLTIRNLFPDRIAMRLDEPEQVDMVLGDGARDRGAACELISSDPATGAGVAFVRLESDPDPVRVRAGWVSDADIADLAAACYPDPVPLELEGVPA